MRSDRCVGDTAVVRSGPLEITDLIWSFDGDLRLPVSQEKTVVTLCERGQARAARIVARIPASAGVLDPDEVDALGLRVHYELQRLGEELQLGRRVTALVETLLDGSPVRLVDVGCGLGHVIRSIAWRGDLPAYVELVGVDLNPVLTAEAARLASAERLACRFVTGDAFAPGVAVDGGVRTIVISSGLMHHLAPADLAGFFAAQTGLGVAAFAHWDIAPCLWSTLGAWIFHQARMREPVSRHDGVMSARRAHAADLLLVSAAHGAPGYAVEVREGSRWHPRALDVLRPVVGVRR